MSTQPVALFLKVVPGAEGLYDGHDVRLSGHAIGHRPYDGSCSQEVADEVLAALAGLLRERLGWPEIRKDPE